MMNTSVYYLTGMGGLLTEDLGAALISRGLVLDGRALSGEFRELDFRPQVEFVAEDLTTRHWSENGIVIANSFGAYLFLHAQSQLPPYIGRVVLLSPIVGEFSDEDGLKNFVPPRASRLQELASETNLSYQAGLRYTWESMIGKVIQSVCVNCLDIQVQRLRLCRMLVICCRKSLLVNCLTD
jgi:hypothetical protein